MSKAKHVEARVKSVSASAPKGSFALSAALAVSGAPKWKWGKTAFTCSVILAPVLAWQVLPSRGLDEARIPYAQPRLQLEIDHRPIAKAQKQSAPTQRPPLAIEMEDSRDISFNDFQVVGPRGSEFAKIKRSEGIRFEKGTIDLSR